MGTQDGTHGSLRHRQAHSLSFEFLSGICKEITLRTTHTAEMRLHVVIRLFTLLRTQEQGFPGAMRAFLASSEGPG